MFSRHRTEPFRVRSMYLAGAFVVLVFTVLALTFSIYRSDAPARRAPAPPSRPSRSSCACGSA